MKASQKEAFSLSVLFCPNSAFPPIEVKQYPAYRAATYQTDRKLVNAANSVFYPLYQHISSNEISRTAPLEIHYPLRITFQKTRNQLIEP